MDVVGSARDVDIFWHVVTWAILGAHCAALIIKIPHVCFSNVSPKVRRRLYASHLFLMQTCGVRTVDVLLYGFTVVYSAMAWFYSTVNGLALLEVIV